MLIGVPIELRLILLLGDDERCDESDMFHLFLVIDEPFQNKDSVHLIGDISNGGNIG